MMDCPKNCMRLPKIKDQRFLAKIYSLADIFVICSKKENFPTTCLESQCCGTPVVGFDAGGTKETSVFDEHDFVPVADIDRLEDRIRYNLNESRQDTAIKAHKLFSKDEMIKKYLQLYDEDGVKKRLLLIDVNCKFSSTGKIVYDLFTGFKQFGRDAAVCYGRGDKIKEDGLYKFGLDIETLIHGLLARITGLNGCFSFFSTRRLLKFIKKYNPDVIHIHELHAYFVNIKPLIKYIKKMNIKILWTFHCEYMYTGKCGYSHDCEKYQSICGNCPELRSYPKSLFFDKTRYMHTQKIKLLRDFDFTIVTPSLWLADKVKKSFLKEKRIEVIHNGIDTTIFYPSNNTLELRRELGIQEETKVALFVAPDLSNPIKGGEYILQLAKRMEKEDVVFLIVGDGEIPPPPFIL